jgi:hypothetical protein
MMMQQDSYVVNRPTSDGPARGFGLHDGNSNLDLKTTTTMRHLLILSIFFPYTLIAQGKYDGGDGDGFATTIINDIVLPIQAIDFTVTVNGNSIKAGIRIISDEPICMIQLQRSTDGNSFFIVNTISAVSPGFTQDRFAFIDEPVPPGDLYYRAAIHQCDGDIVFSKTILLKANERDRWWVNGNVLRYQTNKAGWLQCYNQSGQLVYSKYLNEGSTEINLPMKTAGIYALRFNNETKIRLFIPVN